MTSETNVTPTQAIGAARRALLEVPHLPLYPHRNAPKRFTLPQMFALLAVGSHLRIPSYRRLEARLRAWPALLNELGIEQPPDASTLQRYAKWFERNPPLKSASAQVPTVAPPDVRKRPSASVSRRIRFICGLATVAEIDTSMPALGETKYFNGTRYYVIKRNARTGDVVLQRADSAKETTSPRQ